MATLEAFPAAEREAFTSACRRHGFLFPGHVADVKVGGDEIAWSAC